MSKQKELEFNYIGKTFSTRIGGVEYWGECRKVFNRSGTWVAQCKFYNATDEYFYKEIA